VSELLELRYCYDVIPVRSPSPRRRRSRSFSRPTVSSLTRARSISPAFVGRMHDVCLNDSDVTPVEDRPPFVVRKVGSASSSKF